jgi:hypothetical protein
LFLNGNDFKRKEKMKKVHDIRNISISGDMIELTIDGKDYKFDITKISQKLSKAPEQQRNNFVVSPSGYGISWPDLDEDLSIDGLLGIKHECPIVSTVSVSQ